MLSEVTTIRSASTRADLIVELRCGPKDRIWQERSLQLFCKYIKHIGLRARRGHGNEACAELRKLFPEITDLTTLRSARETCLPRRTPRSKGAANPSILLPSMKSLAGKQVAVTQMAKPTPRRWVLWANHIGVWKSQDQNAQARPVGARLEPVLSARPKPPLSSARPALCVCRRQ